MIVNRLLMAVAFCGCPVVNLGMNYGQITVKLKLRLKFLASFGLSIALVPIWGLGLLSASTASPTIGMVTFLVTILVLAFVPTKLGLRGSEKLMLLVGPTFYVFMAVLVTDTSNLIMLPILWIYVLSVVVLFSTRRFLASMFCIIIAFISCFYVLPFNNSYSIDGLTTPDYGIQTFEEYHNLNELKVLDANHDTTGISRKGMDIVMVETWNETCPPCIRAIVNLSKDKVLAEKLTHIYLYQSRGDRSLEGKEIFEFPQIEKKENIYVDPNNSIFRKLALSSYPTFLFFDRNGDLVYRIEGFQDRNEPTTTQRIYEVIEKLNQQKS